MKYLKLIKINMLLKNNITLLRMIFWRAMAAIYWMAFTSLYCQLPGLFGYDGITPIYWNMRGRMEQFRTDSSLKMFQAFPSFLWFSDKINPIIVKVLPILHEMHELDNVMHVMILFASVLSFLMATGYIKFLIHPVWFTILWLWYNSIFWVGGLFMSFQWDTLLLEAGFLTIFFAPSTPNSVPGVFTKIVREMIRWLMFRLMFGSGITKLLSDWPTWWGLTALNYHFESQPLPNGISWYAHHLPDHIKRLGVVDTFIVQLFLPILFFSPLRAHRIFSGIRQNILMIMIMITGNYNFFNLLTMVINLVNFDDEFILFVTPHRLLKLFNFDIPKQNEQKESLGILRMISSMMSTTLMLGITLYIYSIFDFGVINEERALHRLFTLNDLKYILEETNYVMYFFIYIATFIFWIHSIEWVKILNEIADIRSFIKSSFKVLFYTGLLVIVGVFFVGTISIFNLNKQLSKYGNTQKAILSNFHIVNSYGLFRRMTGVEGREELIFYGSDNGNEWKLYEFYHKPTKKKIMPTFIAPHQPRLDWQLWFSAMQPGISSRNEYVMILAQKLLTNSPSVLNLFKTNPFQSTPPKFIKINKLIYHFTEYEELKSGKWIPENWWKTNESKNIHFMRPISSNSHLNASTESAYPLHPLQNINLLFAYIGFYISMILIWCIKHFYSSNHSVKVDQIKESESIPH